MQIIYLDQNYASRISKHMLGMEGNDHFGALYEILCKADLLIPPSTFHVLELRGGYLSAPFQSFFPGLSQGFWVRPWQEVLQRQVSRGAIEIDDFLCKDGDWDTPADLSLLEEVVNFTFDGSFEERAAMARHVLYELLDSLIPSDAYSPFVDLLSRLLAFRNLNEERQPHDSDLNDLIMASTVRPYVDFLATDRFVREALEKIGEGEGVFSGRRHEVNALASTLLAEL